MKNYISQYTKRRKNSFIFHSFVSLKELFGRIHNWGTLSATVAFNREVEGEVEQ